MDYSYLDLNHLDSILAIEKESNPYPWTVVNFKDCLDKGYYSLALEEEKNLIGFAIMAISTEESHLLNIGITKDARGNEQKTSTKSFEVGAYRIQLASLANRRAAEKFLKKVKT